MGRQLGRDGANRTFPSWELEAPGKVDSVHLRLSEWSGSLVALSSLFSLASVPSPHPVSTSDVSV